MSLKKNIFLFEMILKNIKKKIVLSLILTSGFSNKSLMISRFSFSTARCNAVL